jgi:hypothetical protein
MAKSTKAAKEFRVNTVYKLLVDGKSRTDILQFCSDEWDISDRQGDNYIAEARKKIEHDCTISRQEFLAETIVGLRSIRSQAERRGQLQVAVNSMRLMTELIGIDGKPS